MSNPMLQNMDNKSNKAISRRDFLKIAGASGLATTGLTACGTSGKQDSTAGTTSLPSTGQMTYRTNPTTGDKVSLLGFGMMRLPSVGGRSAREGNEEIDQNMVNELVDYALEHGVNYFDTSPAYCRGGSERATGIALSRHPRDKYFIATKLSNFAPSTWTREGSIAMYQNSLKQLQTDYIDVYQLHNIKVGDFDTVFGENGAFKALLEAKKEGKIGFIGATAHGTDSLEKLVEEHRQDIDTLMFPYNIVETQGHRILQKAKEKGIGTIAMKPLAGGNLDNRPLALRFIAASGVCDISIPGMGDVAEVDKNAAVRENLSPLTEAELEEAEKAKKELGSRFCRRCGYCAPCTVGIDIPSNFLFVNYLRKYGLADWAAERYRTLKVNASDCIQCGACEQRCPYNLPIRQMLKGVVSDFARYEESKKY